MYEYVCVCVRVYEYDVCVCVRVCMNMTCVCVCVFYLSVTGLDSLDEDSLLGVDLGGALVGRLRLRTGLCGGVDQVTANVPSADQHT